jgi:hypothetical protein
MEIELEKARLFEKKIVVIIQRDLDFRNFRTLAQKVIEYENLADLKTLINNIEEL